MVGIDSGFVKIQERKQQQQHILFFKRSDTNEKERTKVASGCDNVTIERTRYRVKRKVLHDR